MTVNVVRCAWLAGMLIACQPALDGEPRYGSMFDGPRPAGVSASAQTSVLDEKTRELVFDGGYIDLELYRTGGRIDQVARNRYIVPVALRWSLTELDNVEPDAASAGVVVLPAAAEPYGEGAPVVLATLYQQDLAERYRRTLTVSARLGDPRARPRPYAYALPYPLGLTFTVLQSFHGAFSHRGSNEYAVDFHCPVATPVLAARDGVVVAVNASAQTSGTTRAFLDDKRANFVVIRHDDGTLGEYMHLAPSGIVVRPGQPVARGDRLALSGNTGFSSTPHLHFQVMTAAGDGIAKRSFPFVMAVAPNRSGPPIEGKRYSAWE